MSIGDSGSVASTTSSSPGSSSAILRRASASGSGQARPRASTVVTIPIVTTVVRYELAAVMSTGSLERLYSGLSLLVTGAAEGRRCAALAAFGMLTAMLDDDLLRRAQEPEQTPSLAWAGRETFARSLASLRDTALELVDVYACAASVETMALTEADLEGRLKGVMSTPRFLRETGGATLLFV